MGTIATAAIALVGVALCLLSFVSRLTGKKSCCGEKAPKVKVKKLAISMKFVVILLPISSSS